MTTRRWWDTPASPSTDRPGSSPRVAPAGRRRPPAAALLVALFALGAPSRAVAVSQDAGDSPAPSEEPREAAPPAPPPGTRRVFSPGPGEQQLEIAAGPGSVIGKDELLLKEYVDIRAGDTRLQADNVRYVPSTRQTEAWGNVVLDFGGARIAAERLEYNLGTGIGTFYVARGYAEPSYTFEASRIDKISETELVLHDATFSACTQPIPYWSFKVDRGLLRLNDYAYLHGLSFRIGRVPVFYTPYLVWPMKSDRSAGLLFPEFGFSQRNGTVISNAFYWPIRRNMDATFFLDYMSLAGYGSGLEYRYVPTATGRGYFTGYYIRDQIAKDENRPDVSADRWVINYGHNQDFDLGWRLFGNANFISDFDYYLDFERDLRLSTTPQAVSNVHLSRNWGFYSLNMLGERREQLVSVAQPTVIGSPVTLEQDTIVRWVKPEVELRGSRRRLGPAPLFLSLEGSAGAFDKGAGGADYQRLDVFPVLSSQVSPVPWFDIDINAGVRETYYTKTQGVDLGCDNVPGTGDFGEGNNQEDFESVDPTTGIFTAAQDVGCDGIGGTGDSGELNGVRDLERVVILDDAFNRLFLQGGVALIGPKTHRVFDTPDSSFSPHFKHTFEPQIRYTYRSQVDDPLSVITFDDVDTVPTHQSRLTYALVTRLYAKRPVETTGTFGFPPGQAPGALAPGGTADPGAAERQLIRPLGYGDEAGTEESAEQQAGTGPPEKRLSTVEIASLEISQDYSFLGPLSTSLALGTPTEAETSQLSAVRASLRLNPSARAGLDVRTSFDILFRQIRDASLSANIRSPGRGFVDLTWSLVRDLEGQALVEKGLAFLPPFDRSQIGLNGETNFINHRLLVGLQVNYELGDVSPGEPRLRDQRYKLGYNTQCCGFQFEYLSRNYVDSHQNEFRFLINLRGVGNVVDLHSGSGGALPGTFPSFGQ